MRDRAWYDKQMADKAEGEAGNSSCNWAITPATKIATKLKPNLTTPSDYENPRTALGVLSR